MEGGTDKLRVARDLWGVRRGSSYYFSFIATPDLGMQGLPGGFGPGRFL